MSGNRSVEAQNLSLKRVEQNDLLQVKNVFQDPVAVQYFESGLPTQDADWIQGGAMYERFQEWVRRSQNNELGWWIMYSRGSLEVMGLIGLKHEKSNNSIDVAVLCYEKFQKEQYIVEAICHLYWYYSQTLVLDESTVVVSCHANNTFCQRSMSCFGLSAVSTHQQRILFKGLVKHVMLKHTASIMDQVQGFLQQAAAVSARNNNSSPTSTTTSTRINYSLNWKQKLISSNAKKVEFLNASVSQIPEEGEYLPCIDTNQLTTIGTVCVPMHLHGQALSVSVSIAAEDGTAILQANKSKRRKNSQQSTEKLEHSSVTVDQDGCAEIRIQAANVLKSGLKRQKCFAIIALKRGSSEVLEQFVSDPFYIIAKLNYKNYEKLAPQAAAAASVSSNLVQTPSQRSVNSSSSSSDQLPAKRARMIGNNSLVLPVVKEEEHEESDALNGVEKIEDDFLQLNSQQDQTLFLPSFMTPQAQVSSDFMQFPINMLAQKQQQPTPSNSSYIVDNNFLPHGSFATIPYQLQPQQQYGTLQQQLQQYSYMNVQQQQYAQQQQQMMATSPLVLQHAMPQQQQQQISQQQPYQQAFDMFAYIDAKQAAAQAMPAVVFDGSNVPADQDFFNFAPQEVQAQQQQQDSCCGNSMTNNMPANTNQIDQFLEMLSVVPVPTTNNTAVNPSDFLNNWTLNF